MKNMKRTLMITVALIMMFALVACDGDTETPTPTPTPNDIAYPPIDINTLSEEVSDDNFTPEEPILPLEPIVFNFNNVSEDSYSFMADNVDGYLVITIHDENIAPILYFEDSTTLLYNFKSAESGILLMVIVSEGEHDIQEVLEVEIYGECFVNGDVTFDFENSNIIVTLTPRSGTQIDEVIYTGEVIVSTFSDADRVNDAFFSFRFATSDSSIIVLGSMPKTEADVLAFLIGGKWMNVNNCGTISYSEFKDNGTVIMSEDNGWSEVVNFEIDGDHINLWTDTASNRIWYEIRDDGSLFWMGLVFSRME